MAFQGFNIETVCFCWKDEKCNYCDITFGIFQKMIESCQWLYEHISSLVCKLIPSCKGNYLHNKNKFQFYLPAVNMYRVLSRSKSKCPWKCPLTNSWILSLHLAWRFWNSWRSLLTLRPFGVKMSGFLLTKCSHSTPVISLKYTKYHLRQVYHDHTWQL